MTITIHQRAKFALLYETSPRAVMEHGVARVYNIHDETSVKQAAAIEIDGLLLTSSTPKSAAEAAKINEAIERIAQWEHVMKP